MNNKLNVELPDINLSLFCSCNEISTVELGNNFLNMSYKMLAYVVVVPSLIIFSAGISSE